jgi:tetratricopeptide (TPR) repeat protein
MRNYFHGMVITLGALALIALSAVPSQAQAAGGAAAGAAAGGQAGKPQPTMAEYNAFQACNGMSADAAGQVKCLDDFLSKYPTSSYLQYAYQLEYVAYGKLKNYAKAIEAADKLIAMDGPDAGVKAQAALARVQAFQAGYDPKTNDTAALTKDRDLALSIPKMLSQIPPKQGMSAADMAKALQPAVNIADDQAGWADIQLKDYPSAVTVYKDAITNKPDDAAATYELGTAYLAMNPPQSLDGFWAIARAINLKVPTADKVQDYLRSKILAYEQPGCDSQVDDQLKEMVQLAANSPDRPATYTIPSAADLTQIRSASTIVSIVGDLSGGGDKAKMTWLATCGSELSAVSGKIIDVQPGDSTIDFMVYTGATPEDMQAATTANMDVKVYTAMPATPPPAPAGGTAPTITPQPDVSRLAKDDPIVFSGTLSGYDPSPFLLHWTDVKVDPSAIPAEKGAAKKPARGGTK